MKLSLAFADNSTGHEDIVLSFAGQKWICDSYYFALDDDLRPGVEDAEKIRAVLRRLLEQWREALLKLNVEEVAFLPYDFSDQYTGWLRCTRTHAGFAIVQGWSSVEGWSFYPSNIGALLHQLEGFRSVGPFVEVPTKELLEAINESLSRAA